MDLHQDIIKFDNWNRREWLRKVDEIYLKYATKQSAKEILFTFVPEFTRDKFEPLHLVTLACLIQYLYGKGYKVFMLKSNIDVHDYIFNELDFSAYWRGGQNHVNTASSEQIFNLWRIVEDEKDLYAKNVEEYFRRNYFVDKDLSAVSVSLVEAFYNVFDHARAGGNAFSIIFYDKQKQLLSYAVADFGIGIPTSVRLFNPDITSDVEAIKWAIVDNSTVRSTDRNRGFGLGNILGAASTARIFSNHGLLVKSNDKFKCYHIDNFSFPGTLIYLTIDMTTFEEEEVFDLFSL